MRQQYQYYLKIMIYLNCFKKPIKKIRASKEARKYTIIDSYWVR